MPGLRLNKGVERYLSVPLLNILGTATHWHAELVTNEALSCCRHRLDFETSQMKCIIKRISLCFQVPPMHLQMNDISAPTAGLLQTNYCWLVELEMRHESRSVHSRYVLNE